MLADAPVRLACRSHAIVAAAHQLQCGAVLDLGAGVGRLAQCLALQYGLRVCGVDCSSDFQIKAEQRSVRLIGAELTQPPIILPGRVP